MNRIVFFIIVFFLLIPITNADIDINKLITTGKKIGKDFFINKLIEQTNVSNIVGESLNSSNPKLYSDVQELCEKTASTRTFLWVLGILSVLGLIAFYPAGIILLIVTFLTYLNYICLI
ncbi:hypothetical protein HQ533_06090 [Candidatus Woesearchaeota archaeon]|nr:hypothetical protein [Candidatus Woesearchaeota archaeon]